MYTDTVEELPGYPVQNCPSGSFLFWGGSVCRGGLVYDIVWRRCPRRTPWMMLRTPVCSYPIIVTHLSFNFLCLVLLYSIYLNGDNSSQAGSKIQTMSECMSSRVQWFWLFFTFWGITTHPWHPKCPRIWKLAKTNFQLHAWPAEIFVKNRKMRFFGMISKFNVRSPVWQVFTIFSACFIYGILNTLIKF